MILRALINKIQDYWVRRSSASFVNSLRRKGIEIGEGTYFQDPRYTEIDDTRPSLVSIGANCFFNKYFELHTHDWVSHVFIHSGRDMINSSGRIVIGNNVAFGRHVMILKGVTIGDNCFIGANSVVSHSIPGNSVAVGCPAKVIMSLDEYYKKRLSAREEEAFDYARSIVERYGRMPVPEEFKEEFPLFVSGSQIDEYPMIPIRFQLGPSYERYKREHKAKYASFDEFLKAAGI